ncbi:MAG: gliding motility protein GldC [Saprospiraceae bacterium]|nr:gliding motility protein GldC [Bacteroidia bacterium]NNE13972.1 gliding motility protein GldC [Saprospiraceae bacterium]NNL92768.1 gliding motility protein GldC [Saprospiraceae bacterium]
MPENKSVIAIEIELNEEKVPSKIEWTAASPEGPVKRESKAMLLSLFDKETLDTFKIDLWTTEMQVAEMDRMMFHTLKALSESYFNATKNEELANQMRNFVQYFGEFTKIIPTE